jgi:folate-binding protein YgfZ
LQSRTSIKADQSHLDAVNSGCGLIRWSGATVVEHSGPDALDLLNRLTTKELLSVGIGSSRRTALTSDRGRVVDVFLVAHRGENDLLLISDSLNSERLISAIDYYTIIEDAELKDCSESNSRISLIGPTSREVVESALEIVIESDAVITFELGAESIFVVSDTSRGTEWIDVVCEKGSVENISGVLIAAGAIEIDQANFDHFRIDRAIPGSDREYGEHANPIEAGLLHLIDWEKGCYVGQEVIARLDAYDKVQRNVKVLRSASPITEGAKLVSGTKPAGIVTSSSALETQNGEYLSLALVRKAFFEPETELDVEGVTVIVR